jgi:predicted amidophosphoribosyltransferase
MKNNIRQINGNWDLGYTLDKHTLYSAYNGHNEYGRPQFDTTRSEIGEALFKLKYRNDWTQVAPLAQEVANSIYPKFSNVGLLIPMPASTQRPRQPVTELAVALGKIVGKPVFENILIKAPSGQQSKNLTTKEDKVNALNGCFSINDGIGNEGAWNVLIVDDLFDTGASLEQACIALRGYKKIKRLYAATLTWR